VRSDRIVGSPAGRGKTAVGLLIAQSTLNEVISKAVYLTPDNYLVKQVREEAAKLGVATTDDPYDPAFLSAQAVLVTNYQKLINGKSAFGVVGDGRNRSTWVSSTTTRTPRWRGPRTSSGCGCPPATRRTGSCWSCSRRTCGTSRRTPGRSWRTRTPPLWRRSRSGRGPTSARKILRPHREERVFMFVWPLLAEVMHLCTATAMSAAIEIKPSCPPIDRIPSFVRARRRVYLTATLADDSALVTDFGADPALVAKPVTPGSATDLGERMILATVALNPDLGDEAVRVLARQFADGDQDGDGVTETEPVSVVVLVPSDRAAANWAPDADRIWRVGDLEAGVKELQVGHVGLVVLVNKYDGINLPAGACRLLILDGVPRPLDGVERREAVALADSTVRLAREVQRIEQGMGRRCATARTTARSCCWGRSSPRQSTRPVTWPCSPPRHRRS
jgi:hypothetical protein